MSGKPRKRHSVTQPLDDSYRIIPLTKGQNTLVDVADFERLSKFSWHAYWDARGKTFYARRTLPNGKTLSMHRMILGCKHGEEADHVSWDTLDNRRNNLRRCTHTENVRHRRKRSTSTSGMIGVSFHKRTKTWDARIFVKGRLNHIGCFKTAEEAGRAYDARARVVFKEFAVLNFPLVPCDP